MPPPPPPSSATAPTRSASAVSFQASSAPQDTSTSIDTRASDEEEEDFGGADDTFASFDARNNTLALLAEDDWFGGRASMFGAVSGHVASLEATANTYSPDFLDRLVDTLVGTPNFAKDMERSFAEFDEKNLTAYSGNAVLDDTAYTANADANTNNINNNTDNTDVEEAEPDPHAVCLVCYDDTLPHQRAILPCGHDGVCGPCHLRLRYLNTDKYVMTAAMCVALHCVASSYVCVLKGCSDGYGRARE